MIVRTTFRRTSRAIHDAVGRMQRHVRAITPAARGRSGRSGCRRRSNSWHRSGAAVVLTITFITAVAVEEDQIGDDLKETIYRIVRKA